jgi:hypothetical protein
MIIVSLCFRVLLVHAAAVVAVRWPSTMGKHQPTLMLPASSIGMLLCCPLLELHTLACSSLIVPLAAPS